MGIGDLPYDYALEDDLSYVIKEVLKVLLVWYRSLLEL